MKRLKPLSSWCLLSFSPLTLIACNNSNQELPISISISPQFSAVSPGQTIQLTATVTNNATGLASLATTENGTSEVQWSATAGSIDDFGNYTAPSGAQLGSAYVIARSKKDHTKFANALIHIVPSGTVSSTANGQVALYSISPRAPANVSVQFGADTNYGRTTWAQQSINGEATSLFVAGMKANTPYHMRAVVQFSDGTQFLDSDHVFTTPAGDPSQWATVTATTTPGQTPQGGVELLDLASGIAWPTVTDLSGNVLWTYTGVPNGSVANPIKLLPNGHFLVNFSEGSIDGANSVLQEIDLTGKVIWQMAAADLNKALATAAGAISPWSAHIMILCNCRMVT